MEKSPSWEANRFAASQETTPHHKLYSQEILFSVSVDESRKKLVFKFHQQIH
jgi:hypothetical protein